MWLTFAILGTLTAKELFINYYRNSVTYEVHEVDRSYNTTLPTLRLCFPNMSLTTAR